MYRYPTASERTVVGENPVDDHNHALGALRYLIGARRAVHGPAAEAAGGRWRRSERRNRTEAD